MPSASVREQLRQRSWFLDEATDEIVCPRCVRTNVTKKWPCLNLRPLRDDEQHRYRGSVCIVCCNWSL